MRYFTSVLIGTLSFAIASCTGTVTPGENPTTVKNDDTGGNQKTAVSLADAGSTANSSAGSSNAPSDAEQSSETPSLPVDINGQEYDPLVPAPATMWRLTNQQYAHTVLDLFGYDLELDLEEDEGTERFLSLGASKVGTSGRGVEQYDLAAHLIAEHVFGSSESAAKLGSCSPKTTTDRCIAEFLEATLTKLFRRPATSDEVARYNAVVRTANDEHVLLGLQFALRAMLNSPNFLYISYAGEPDLETGALRFTSHETAARLSYLLLDSAPDSELLRAAADDELVTSEGIEKQVRRLLKADRARSVASRYFAESWSVNRLHARSKQESVGWSSELLQFMREEFRLGVESAIFERGGDVRELFTAKTSFLNDSLATVYGLPLPGSDDLVPSPLDETRSGLLTSGAVIAANSPQARTSPTLRGLFVLEKLMCLSVPPPPPGVNVELEETPDTSKLTTRERLESHRLDPKCSACHGLFDPVGMVFENYGPIGDYRLEENGKPVDSRGGFNGQEFTNIDQLASFLVNDERVGNCIAQSFYDFAVARHASSGEQGVVKSISDGFNASGFNFQELVMTVVTSPGFRYFRQE